MRGADRALQYAHGLAIAMDGHVRVGLEDNVGMDPETKLEHATNARLIDRVVAVARVHGRDIASCTDSWRLLKLGVPQHA